MQKEKEPELSSTTFALLAMQIGESEEQEYHWVLDFLPLEQWD